MNTIASQTYLIAAFNLLIASHPQDQQLSTIQIVDILCRMVQAEEIRSFHKAGNAWSKEFPSVRPVSS